MGVLAERHARREIDAHLDGLASGGAEIVPLQIGARDSRGLLRLRYGQRETAAEDQRRQRHCSNRLHVNLLLSFRYASVNPCVTMGCRGSNWQRLAGLFPDGVFGVPVRPGRIVLAASPLLMLTMRRR